ncbi:MAG: hypothetical protein WBE34_15520 [Candidatus Nitrosopolaris sp.]
MWKVIKNPKETEDRKMIALELAFKGTKNKIDMLKTVKQMFEDFHNYDYDYDHGAIEK